MCTKKIEWMMSFCIDCHARSYAIQSELQFNRAEFSRILIDTFSRIEGGLPLKHQHLIAIQLTPCHRLHEIAFNIDIPGIKSNKFKSYFTEEKRLLNFRRKWALRLRKAVVKLQGKHGIDAITALPKAIFLIEKRFDVIITERGIAINPLRHDLIEKVKGSGIPLRTIQELMDEAHKICGKPQKPQFEEDIVAAIKWVDGTVIDVVRKIKT